MTRHVSRRAFLGASSAAVAGLLTPGWLTRSFAADDSPLFKISLAEWSLHRAIFAKEIDHLDFAKTAKEEFGIDAVEYVNQFFFDKAEDSSYIQEMKTRAADNGVRSLLIMVDRDGALGDPDEAKRIQAVENHKKWIAAAAELGCHSVRVNAASKGTYEEQLDLAADGLWRLTQIAEDHNLSVIVENHGGLSSNGEWLAEVMRKVDHPHCGTLPDFGNFRIKGDEWYDRYKGVEELMPFAHAVSAKTHDFDEDGNETNTDFMKMMKIVLDAGYHGYVGIEYEGKKLDEKAGIQASLELLKRVRSELAQA